MSLLLAEAAKKLGSDKKIMDSYWEYHERNQNWFFSPNPNLAGAASKPPSFPGADTWKKLTSAERNRKWNNYSSKQRMTISTLAGFGYEGKGINLNNMTHVSKLREACQDDWRDDLYSVFWSDTSTNGKLWLCNVFVGDAIYLYNGKNFTSGNKHYYDPLQIYRGQSFLRKRKRYKDVQAGDIVLFGKSHVEIVTSIQENIFADDGFCSIGAGRGGDSSTGRDSMGSIRCDKWIELYNHRELNNENNTYYTL